MQEIKKILNNFELNLPDDAIKKFNIFINEVLEKNNLINLISNNDLSFILERHLVDSLIPLKNETISSMISNSNILDIGSGGGFPAIPLSIVFPKSRFTLSESIKKKYEFLLWIKEKLKITNIEILNERIDKKHNKQYNTITQRAAGKFEDIIKIALKLLEPNGHFISWLSNNDAIKYKKNFNFIYNYNLKGRDMCLCVVKKI